MRASRALHRRVQPLGPLGGLLHASIVWTSAFAAMGAAAVATGALAPWLPFAATHRHIGAPAMAFCLRCTGARMRLLVDPAFPPDQVAVFVQNHVSLLDAHVASNALPHPFCGLMNAWQFKLPVYGWLMGLSRGIPVPSQAGRRTEILAEAATQRAREGLSILAFPEAHRTRDGKPQRHRSGVYRMAKAAGLPIVPVAVHGLYAINRRGQATFSPGTVTVVLGRPRPTAGRTEEELQELRSEVENWMRPIIEDGAFPRDYEEVAAWPRNGKTVASAAHESAEPSRKPDSCSQPRR